MLLVETVILPTVMVSGARIPFKVSTSPPATRKPETIPAIASIHRTALPEVRRRAIAGAMGAALPLDGGEWAGSRLPPDTCAVSAFTCVPTVAYGISTRIFDIDVSYAETTAWSAMIC
jgi:hypothetical protein